VSPSFRGGDGRPWRDVFFSTLVGTLVIKIIKSNLITPRVMYSYTRTMQGDWVADVEIRVAKILKLIARVIAFKPKQPATAIHHRLQDYCKSCQSFQWESPNFDLRLVLSFHFFTPKCAPMIMSAMPVAVLNLVKICSQRAFHEYVKCNAFVTFIPFLFFSSFQQQK